MAEIRPPVLRASASVASLSPTFSTNISSSPYVLALARLPASTPTYAVATSPPSSAILLYAATPSGLVQTQTLPHEKNGPTAMRVVRDFGGRPTLLSAQQNPGCVSVWDERNGSQPGLKIYPPKNRAILSFDVSPDGCTLASGTDLQSDDASIFYWDSRNPAQPLRTHSSTHSDDITALHFHPELSHLLLSVSTDGLVSTSDAREVDEDEAAIQVSNWGCSIARAGWYSRPGGHGVWAASDMETFGQWSSDLDLLNDFGDVRQPVLPGNRWKTDYLINATDFSFTPGPCGTSGLTLFLGSNSGDIALASVSHDSDAPTWTVRTILQGGHTEEVVRSVLWDQDNGMLLTGDEAGKLTTWRPSEDNADVEMASGEDSNIGTGTKRGRDSDHEMGNKRGRYEG